jgi:uncharacterized Fe-S cluster-containing radical SAM superfamily enzyme
MMMSCVVPTKRIILEPAFESIAKLAELGLQRIEILVSASDVEEAIKKVRDNLYPIGPVVEGAKWVIVSVADEPVSSNFSVTTS